MITIFHAEPPQEVNNMVLGDHLERICVGIFIMFIGWAMLAVAMSFAPFTHSLPYMTRLFVALPISVVFGVPAARIFAYGGLMVLGVYQIPHNISSVYGGKII